MVQMPTATTVPGLDCCPQLEPCEVCDVLEFPYRMAFRPLVQVGDRRQVVPVEVTLRWRLTRCARGLALGDLAYSTTLLPGEQVRLFTSDRHTRFSFDTESRLAYRNQTTSAESFFLAGMASSMSDLSIVENENRSATFHESSVSGGGGAGIDLGIISFGGSVAGSSHDAHSASSFAHQLTQHAQASSRHVESGVRAASSTSVGEVASRTHTETESSDHFESASRSFSNPNHCRALSFFFYHLNKCQTLRWELVAIDRRVEDPAAPTGVTLNPTPPQRQVAVIPSAIVATSKDRLEVAQRTLASVAVEQGGVGSPLLANSLRMRSMLAVATEALAADLRAQALHLVDEELMREGLIDKAGAVTAATKARFGWERELSLPTPGLIVKTCLDECEACEPELHRSIELDIERKALENKLLERQIELLEQSQEYRCCPVGSASDDD